jgi:hypothetical protein
MMMNKLFSVPLIVLVLAANTNSSDAIDGYWLFRAPVDSADLFSGISFARRFGPNKGNGRDIGVLWRQNTPDNEGRLLENEERHCGAWTQFFFDESENIFPDTIHNIYCHAWIYVEETSLPVGKSFGLSVEENYDPSTYYDLRQFNQSLAYPRNATHHNLVVYYNDHVQYVIDSLAEFWGVSFKATGGFPQVLSYPNQKSFCLVNISDSASLVAMDSDDDGISNYTELFNTFTDPFDADTDDDGRFDKYELDNGKNGWDPSDWGTIYIYHPDGVSNLGFVRELNSQFEEPYVSVYFSELDRELSDIEYAKLISHDNSYDAYDFTSTESDPWSLTQLNFQFTIPQPPESISIISVLFGGIWISHINGDTLNGIKAIELINLTGGRNKYMPAKHGKTRAFYVAQIREQIADFISAEGKLYLRAYTKNRLSDATVQVDFVEVRVTAGSSILYSLAPTSALPMAVQSEDTATVTFGLIEHDVAIINGLSVDSIMIGGIRCTIIGEAYYVNSYWNQDFIVPELPADSSYELLITASTNSGVTLSVTEENSVYYMCPRICGDINCDGNANDIIDLTYLVDFIFRGGPSPDIPASADLNGDGSAANILDLTILVDYIFRLGPMPAACP